MTIVPTAVRTGLWYLRRPAYWEHAAARGLRHLRPERDGAEEVAARAWAEERVVTVEQALGDLGLFDPSRGELPRLPHALLVEATARAAEAQTSMGGPGHLDLIYAATRLSGAQRAVETGVAYGWSTSAILAGFGDVSAHLYSVDMPYPRRGNEPWVGVVVPPELRLRWTLIRRPDRRGLDQAIALAGGVVDLVHYDSDKSYQGRMYGYRRMYAALAPGGVFLSDDIQDDFGFRDFVTAHAVPFRVTSSGGKYVGVAVKPGQPRAQSASER